MVEADFQKSDAQIRAIVFERASSTQPNGSRIMIRAIAAAESVDELAQWALQRFERHQVDSLFALAAHCAAIASTFGEPFFPLVRNPFANWACKF